MNHQPVIRHDLLGFHVKMLVIDGVDADDVLLAHVLQEFRDHLVELVRAGVNALVMADRMHPDSLVRALGDGFERHGRLLDEAFAGCARTGTLRWNSTLAPADDAMELGLRLGA